jgi:hypothetical protein
MNENTTQEPLVAEIVSVTLTEQELEQLEQAGSVQTSNINITAPKLELPQGPMWLNGVWHT